MLIDKTVSSLIKKLDSGKKSTTKRHYLPNKVDFLLGPLDF